MSQQPQFSMSVIPREFAWPKILRSTDEKQLACVIYSLRAVKAPTELFYAHIFPPPPSHFLTRGPATDDRVSQSTNQINPAYRRQFTKCST